VSCYLIFGGKVQLSLPTGPFVGQDSAIGFKPIKSAAVRASFPVLPAVVPVDRASARDFEYEENFIRQSTLMI
jgi:hypothetical protein